MFIDSTVIESPLMSKEQIKLFVGGNIKKLKWQASTGKPGFHQIKSPLCSNMLLSMNLEILESKH